MAMSFLTFDDFGAVGDDDNLGNGTDDTVAINAALATGLPVYGVPGKVYRVTNQLDMADRTWLNLLGARINCYTPASYGLTPRNHCKVTNGKIYHYGTDESPDAGDRQTAITIGRYVDGDSYHNIEITNMEVYAARSLAICVVGTSHEILIQNILCPDSTGSGAVIVHWSWSGSWYTETRHPYNIVIRNISMGEFNASSAMASHIVWISGAYNVTAENLHAEKVGRLCHVFCGDYGTTYAPAEIRKMICKGVHVRNISSPSSFAGVSVEGKPYISGSIVDMDVTLEHANAICNSGTTTASRGVSLQSAQGVKVRGGCFDGFHLQGVVAGDGLSKNSGIYGTTFRNGKCYGLNLGTSSHPCEDIEVMDCVFENNNLSNFDLPAGAAILLSGSRRCKIERNRISGSKHPAGVQVSAAASDPRLRDNHVWAIASGGIGYAIGSATRGSGNTVGAGIALFSSGTVSNQ